MTATVAPNEHDTTPERVLFIEFALHEKTWKLGWLMCNYRAWCGIMLI